MPSHPMNSNLGKLPILGRVPLPEEAVAASSEGQQQQQQQQRVWLYTGLGGRGLVHHAYLGGYVLRVPCFVHVVEARGWERH